MPRTPQDTEDRLNRTIKAWAEQAPTAKFSGMTLVQFKEAVKPSLEHRAAIVTCGQGAVVARVSRNTADVDSNDLVDKVVNSVKGDLNFGENSPLYRAFGYVLKSERASGLTRRKRKGSGPSKASGVSEAAALTIDKVG